MFTVLPHGCQFTVNEPYKLLRMIVSGNVKNVKTAWCFKTIRVKSPGGHKRKGAGLSSGRYQLILS